MRPSGLPGFRDGTVGQTRRVKRGPSRDLRRGRGKHRCPERVHPDASWTLGSPACRARRCALPLLGDEEPSARDSGTAEQRGSGAFVHFVFGKPSARDSGTAEQRGSGAAEQKSIYLTVFVCFVSFVHFVFGKPSARDSGTAEQWGSGTAEQESIYLTVFVCFVSFVHFVFGKPSARDGGTVGQRYGLGAISGIRRPGPRAGRASGRIR